MREASIATGVAVAEAAFRRGLSSMNRPDDPMRRVKSGMYDPAHAECLPG